MSGRRHGRLPHQALFVRRLDASAAALDVARVSDRDAHVCYEVLRGYELQYTRVVGGVYSRVEGIRATRRCHMSFRLRLLALLGLLALAASSLTACVVVPVPARGVYVAPPPVVVAPYPHYGYGYGYYRRW